MGTHFQPAELRQIFRDNVVARRMELGLTQLEVARRACLSQPAIAQFESGDRVPLLDTLAMIAEALKTTPNALLSEGMFALEKNSQPA